MNRIARKRLKRRRKLEGRVKCHGNTVGCHIEHYVAVSKAKPKPKLIVKTSLWKKIISVFKN